MKEGENGDWEGWGRYNKFTRNIYSLQVHRDSLVSYSGQHYSAIQSTLLVLTPGLWFYILYKYIIKEERVGSFIPLSNHVPNSYWAPNPQEELRSKRRNSAERRAETVHESMKSQMSSEKDESSEKFWWALIHKTATSKRVEWYVEIRYQPIELKFIFLNNAVLWKY